VRPPTITTGPSRRPPSVPSVPRSLLESDRGSNMFHSRTLVVLAAAVALFSRLPAPSAGHDDKKEEMAALHRPDGLKWVDGPASLPPGAKFAVLEGDPTKPGPFVFRVKVPDGYRVPSHTHPKPERVTVISGTFNLGMGDKFDAAKTEALPAGTYGTWP